MAQRQQALVDAVLRDRDVANVSSFIGVDGTNMAFNNGRLLITLKPRDERSDNASEIIRSLEEETKNVGHLARHAAGAGPHDRQHGWARSIYVLPRKP